jgi:hypothetical protein
MITFLVGDQIVIVESAIAGYRGLIDA